MDEIVLKIAGEITLSQNSGASLKKWREIFGITQTELASYLKVTPSTISDYEGNRRKSPGINIIKRFVNAICEIDKRKGGWTLKKMQTDAKPEIYNVTSFKEPVKTLDFNKKIDAKAVANKDIMQESKLYGATYIDSLRAILELPADEFIKIYGSTTDRALIFSNVQTGRSPLVAIRVTRLKPALVVLHNVSEVDKIAQKIAETERIPLVTTLLPLDEIRKRLANYENV